MRFIFQIFLVVSFSGNISAQQDFLDSLYQQVNNSKEDTSKVLALSELADYYGFNQFDSCILYAEQAIALSKKLDYLYGAVDEKKKQHSHGYEPIVSVTTKKSYGKVAIRVLDNGNGIPKKILDKIFQPFFTTKPTGQGTGLGLSLAYDIIKAHGGELKVETKEGEGSEFIVSID